MIPLQRTFRRRALRVIGRLPLAAVLMLVASRLDAQSGGAGAQPQHLTGGNEGKRPIGWQVRYDAGPEKARSTDSISFVQMTPGFHVTTGTAAIMWHADSTARGDFTLEGSMFLFPTNGRDQEGYGILLGGVDLGGPTQRYTYFLLRNDGRFLVKQRRGDAFTTLVDWKELPAIKRQAGGDAMKNDLQVEVQGGTVRFLVNGALATVLPRAQVNPDGIFGLRINHRVNAHVVSVGRPKAP